MEDAKSKAEALATKAEGALVSAAAGGRLAGHRLELAERWSREALRLDPTGPYVQLVYRRVVEVIEAQRAASERAGHLLESALDAWVTGRRRDARDYAWRARITDPGNPDVDALLRMILLEPSPAEA
jgi:hypothetical protein